MSLLQCLLRSRQDQHHSCSSQERLRLHRAHEDKGHDAKRRRVGPDAPAPALQPVQAPPVQQQDPQHKQNGDLLPRPPKALQDASFHLAEQLAGNNLKPILQQPPAQLKQAPWRSSSPPVPATLAQQQAAAGGRPHEHLPQPAQLIVPPPYALFPTQQQAFEFWDRHPAAASLRAYAVEASDGGRRNFLVTSPKRLWREYCLLLHEQRHHYEIVREGRPCHLYFDLEFCPQANPGVIGGDLVDLLLHEVDLTLQACFDLPLQRPWVLELDSSTPTKFSRHVIIRLPGLAFADNAHVGALVRRVVAGALVRAQSCSHLAGLVVAREGGRGGETLFVDMSVYSRNRAFRLYLSSKAGKQSHLVATPRFGGATLTPQQLFFASLITNTDLPPCRQPQQQQQQQHQQQQQQRQRQQQQGQQGWHCQRKLSLLRMDGMDTTCTNFMQLMPDDHPWRALLRTGQPSAAGNGSGRAAAWAEAARGSEARHGMSPFPELQRFVESVCTEGGVQGHVRTWLVSPDANVVLFNMRDNRWCGNVGRAHKSNGIYIVVDLEMGVRFQKCYDVDCRDYRSEYMPLPADVWEACRVHMQQLRGPSGDSDMQLTAVEVLQSVGSCEGHRGCTQDSAFDEACLALLAEFEDSGCIVRQCVSCAD